MTTVAEMLDMFVPVHFPKLARRTQIDGMAHVEKLKAMWGSVHVDELKPRTIGMWMNGGPDRGKIQRGKIVSVLATAYKYGVGEFFCAESNPTRDLRFPKSNKRTRYVTPAEFAAVRSICSERLQAAMDLAYITGQRQNDILKLRWDHIDVHGNEASGFRPIMHIRQGKTGKRFGIVVSEALEEVLLRCKRMPPALPRAYVLRNKDGERYSSAGFRSMAKRAINRALERGLIKTPFTWHDLRAATASDHPDIEKAADLLGHQNSQMTKSVYDRSVRLVQPLK
jgi:integrase